MNSERFERHCEHGSRPLVINVEQAACENENFRMELWTGKCLQMTLMCIPVQGEIGWEVHEDTDQYLRVEQGMGMATFGECKINISSKCKVECNDGIFVPAGTWHNIINIGKVPLKISSVYAPPHHPKGTIQKTKADAERME